MTSEFALRRLVNLNSGLRPNLSRSVFGLSERLIQKVKWPRVSVTSAGDTSSLDWTDGGRWIMSPSSGDALFIPRIRPSPTDIHAARRRQFSMRPACSPCQTRHKVSAGSAFRRASVQSRSAVRGGVALQRSIQNQSQWRHQEGRGVRHGARSRIKQKSQKFIHKYKFLLEKWSD